MFVIDLTIVLFWFSCFLVVYPYLIYPVILIAAHHLRFTDGTKDQDKRGDAGETLYDFPTVSMIVAAYNEQEVIAGKIENTLKLKYSGQLEIIVISDGSTDKTAAIVRSYVARHENVKLVEMSKQSGKTEGLNTAIPQAIGEIVVFTDANAMFESNALLELIGPFQQEKVGYTVGSALYLEDGTEAVNISEGLYWRFELAIKKLESDFYSVVGGDGAIYAIRKELYEPLKSYDISDFVNPLQIISKNFRGVFVPDARSYENGTEDFHDEFRRKRRIVNRSWGGVRRNVGLFSWAQHSKFLFMLYSHKVIRWFSFALVLFALIASLIIGAALGSVLYLGLSAIILFTLVLGFLGWKLDDARSKMPKPVYLIYYFYLIGLAGMLGIIDELRGHRQSIWQPSR